MTRHAALLLVLAACGGRVDSEPISAASPSGVLANPDAGTALAIDAARDVADVFETTSDAPAFTAAEIKVGNTDACARELDGTVLCWGWNSSGQVGDGTTAEFRRSPTFVNVAPGGPPLAGIAEIVVGGAHTCARKTEGTVFCWGFDADGQLGDGTVRSTIDSVRSPTQVLVALRGAPLTGAGELALGERHTCARMMDGTVLCWGWNAAGQAGDGTTITPRPSPTRVLVDPGGIPLADVVEITAGDWHTCGRKNDGSVFCWGKNDYGQLGDGTFDEKRTSATAVPIAPGGLPLTGVVAISAGGTHTSALQGDGTVVCWGSGESGEIGDGTTTVHRASPTPVLVAPGVRLRGVAEIAAGIYHTCARKTDGTVLCWGDDGYGEIGDGLLAPTGMFAALRPWPTPVLVAPRGAVLRGISQIAAGGFDTCVRKMDASVMCWGLNEDGEVGDGTTISPRPSPTFVAASST